MLIISGESNSAMKSGWSVPFIESISHVHPEFVVVNKSVPSTGILNTISNLNFLIEKQIPISHLIIDSFIQDSQFYKNNPDIYELILDRLFSYLMGQGVIVFYLFFRIRWDDSGPTMKLKSTLVNLCLKHRIHFFDAHDAIFKLAENKGVDIKNLFLEDAVHPIQEVNKHIAVEFCKFYLDNGILNKSPVILGNENYLFHVVGVDEFDGQSLPIIYRKTSIAEYGLIKVSSDDNFELLLNLPNPNYRLIGIMFDASVSCGSFYLKSGNVEFYKNLNNRFFKGPLSHNLFARPIHQDLFLEKSSVVKCVASESGHEFTEKIEVDISIEMPYYFHLYQLILLI